MDSFVQQFGGQIKGVLTGFDRVVFKGLLRPIMFAAGAQVLLSLRGVLNKDYKTWMLAQSAALLQAVEQSAVTTCGRGIIPIPSCHTRKETLAHARQQETGITDGLIGVWSCVEGGVSFRAAFDRERGVPQLRADRPRCKHLYFYYDHPTYGFMSVRLQTWFPFPLQIAVNGREWLRRGLDAAGCSYLKHGNKFLDLADFALAQRLLDAQLDTRWEALLTGLLPEVFPTMRQTLGEHLTYYWTAWQSEWATDYICDSPATVAPVMDRLLRHALLTGTGARVLRYLGRPVRPDDQPHARTTPEVYTRVQTWHDGARIRHGADDNSVKLYNEQNVLRVETTINRPEQFKVFRQAEGEREAPKQRRPLRKGVADLPLRAQVSTAVNQRFTAHMATLQATTPVRDVLPASGPTRTTQGRRVRGLDPLGKDRALLQALADPALGVSGITNRALQRMLGDTPWAHGKTDKALSARITRHLRLLRDHGVLRKLPKQRKYQLTEKGRHLTTLVSVLLGASTQQLLEMAA